MRNTEKTILHLLRLPWLLAAPLLLLYSCSQPRVLKEVFKKQTPHEAYQSSLEKAGLDKTELGQQWIQISRQVLHEAVPVTVPFRETGYFPANKVVAVAYRFDAREGELYSIRLQFSNPPSFRLFGDLYRVPLHEGPTHTATLDTTGVLLEYEVKETGPYTLRLQPELLRSGNYTISIVKNGSLGFPVKGLNSRAIGSFFGDARDGGTRDHHGVDVFAKKGTPVLAATDGVITDAGTNRLGGKVVWQWDMQNGRSLYYAHLDSQLVQAGQRVRKGDVVGLVGNTGNAKHTPPHLHFGIYNRGRGPVDPYPFLHQPDTTFRKLTADRSLISQSVRIKAQPAPRRKKKGAAPAPSATPEQTLGEVLAAEGNRYRVLWPDGRQEYVAASLLEPVKKPLHQRPLLTEAQLTEQPAAGAPVVAILPQKQVVQVLGRHGDYWFVDSGSVSGWLPGSVLKN